MTPLQWFNSYVDAVDFVACLMQHKKPDEADMYAARTHVAYETVKGPAYWASVQHQAGLLMDGVLVLRGEAA